MPSAVRTFVLRWLEAERNQRSLLLEALAELPVGSSALRLTEVGLALTNARIGLLEWLTK